MNMNVVAKKIPKTIERKTLKYIFDKTDYAQENSEKKHTQNQCKIKFKRKSMNKTIKNCIAKKKWEKRATRLCITSNSNVELRMAKLKRFSRTLDGGSNPNKTNKSVVEIWVCVCLFKMGGMWI